MSISVIKPYTFALGFLVVNFSFANDLITFGSHCLNTEARLNQAQNRIEQSLLKSEQQNIGKGERKEKLAYYFSERDQLSGALAECAKTTPNSSYCHNVRRQHREIIHFIQTESEALRDQIHDKSDTKYAITQHNFDEKQADFFAQCRDSDTHYAFIQNIEAYSAVCLLGNNKQSVTCSLF